EVVGLAYSLQIQGDPEPVPEISLPARVEAGPEAGAPAPRFTDWTMFGGDAIELRFVRGSFSKPGPATAWFRLKTAVVDGEPVSQLQRAMAAADFGNGISAAVSWDDFTFVNPELTVFLLREPEGAWIANDAMTAIDQG